MRSSCKQASGCRERKRTPSSRCSNSTTLKLQPAALPSPRPSCSPAPGCSRTPREAPAAAPRLPPRRASEPARLSRGRPDPSWHGARHSRAISSGSRDLAPTCFAGPQRPPPVGRGLSAARPPGAVAAVIGLCRRRRRPRVCPSSELLLRGSQTTQHKTARWHAAFYPGIVVSSTPRRHTPRRASRRRRHSFDCGGWAQQGVTIGLPSCSYSADRTSAGLQGMPAARPRPRAGDRTS